MEGQLMKKEQQKQLLRNEFIDSATFVGAIAFSVFPVAKLLQDGDYLPLMINIMITLVAIVVSIWSYLFRINAIAFLIGRAVRCIMLIWVIFAVQFSLTTASNAYQWMLFSSSVLIITMICGIYVELKNEKSEMKNFEKYKIIDIKKGDYNILFVIPRQHMAEDKYFVLFAVISPAVVAICLRLFRVVNVENFFIAVLTSMLAILLSFYLGKTIGIPINVFLWQKRYGIIFNTEYRDYIEKSKLEKR
jgi:hypothetical protein